LVGTLEEKDHLVDLGLEERIKLKWNLYDKDVWM